MTPDFDPIAFFEGTTEGHGNLKVVMRRSQQSIVRGYGKASGDAIELVQTVTMENKAPKRRSWHLRRVNADHYTGTLTDAIGPVNGEVTGNCLHLAFAMKGGLRAQQWLYLQPGGQVARNRMVVTKFGFAVAHLEETIERTPA